MSLANAALKARALEQARINRQIELGNSRSNAGLLAAWRTELGTENPGASPSLTDPRSAQALKTLQANWQTEVGNEFPDYFGGASPRVIPGLIVPGEGFVRNSPSTYIDNTGTRRTAVANEKRDNHWIGGIRTLLLEGGRTNHFLNSDAAVTQTTPSLGTGSYTLWMEGSGSIAVSAGTATITGAGTATAGTPVTFTVTVAGTVTYTVTGSVTAAQAENGAFATSYVPTLGASVSRATDIYSISFPNSMIEQTFYAQFFDIGVSVTTGGRVLQVGGSADPRLIISENASGTLRAFHNGQTTSNVAAGALNLQKEVRVVVKANNAVLIGISVSGGAETTSADSTAPANANYSNQFLTLSAADPAGNTPGFAAFSAVKVLNGTRTMAEMRAA